MKKFMDDDFLLETATARELYNDHVRNLPIIDYHCHLDPKMIADDTRFGSITEVWLGGDHYKWRAMRSNGVEERFITGNDTSDWEKFEKWAATVPYAFRNPLYHWTHLELKTAFGIEKTLNPATAREIFDACNDKLRNGADMTARGLMRRYGVEVVCTTDDPVDSLEHHRRIKESGFEIKVLPTWRPDKAMNVDDPRAFADYVARLESASGSKINTFADYVDALRIRHDFFGSMGCRLSDHGISDFYVEPCSDAEAADIFAKVVAGHVPAKLESDKLKSRLLYLFGEMNHAAGWAQQFHYGALRNTNSRMMGLLGPDSGFDTIDEVLVARNCAAYLDSLCREGKLTRTILYNLNPMSNATMGAMIGNFQDSEVPGKIQFGAAWWFNDHIEGMEQQMNALSSLGLLSRFVGMLTDSRSFLSYPRHDYFRRIMCNMLGKDAENGLIPYEGYEKERLGQMAADISYFNAKNYFKF